MARSIYSTRCAKLRAQRNKALTAPVPGPVAERFSQRNQALLEAVRTGAITPNGLAVLLDVVRLTRCLAQAGVGSMPDEDARACEELAQSHAPAVFADAAWQRLAALMKMHDLQLRTASKAAIGEALARVKQTHAVAPLADKPKQLSDAEWEYVREAIVGEKAACFRHPRLRAIVNSVLWVSHFDSSWAKLPSSFPPHSTCYGAFYRWRKQGVIQPLLEKLGAAMPAGQPPGPKPAEPPEPVAARAGSTWFSCIAGD